MSRAYTIRGCVGVGVLSLILLAAAARGHTLYVDDDAPPGGDGLSWQTAYTHLQDALGAAGADTAIHVAGGVYRPDRDEDNPGGTGDRSAAFVLLSGVEIYGGYAGLAEPGNPDLRDIELYETVLSGDLADDDGPDFANNDENSYHVVIASGVDTSTRLDGLTITGGNANADDYPDYFGGGVYSVGGSPTIVDCTISENAATFDGGGLYCWLGSSPVLTRCTITGNAANDGAGVYCEEYSGGSITDCTITENEAAHRAAGIFCREYSSPTITDCTISANVAHDAIGGIRCEAHSSPSIVRCTISQNTGSGVSCSDYSHATVSDCEISENTATNITCNDYSDLTVTDCRILAGGSYGFSCHDSSPTVSNCTIRGNSSFGVYCDDSDAVVTDCIISENACGVGCCYGGSSTIRDCVISRNTPQGGVRCDYASASLSGCTICGNAGALGGGVGSYRGTPTLINCVIVGNSAGDYFDGGGVSSDQDSDASLTDCVIAGNWAGGGGAVYACSSSPTMTNCVIAGNSAHDVYGAGGAVDAYDADSVPTVRDCTIVGNTTVSDGGAFSFRQLAAGTVINSTIAGNVATERGGGIYCAQATVYATGNALWGNTASQGAEIALTDDGSEVAVAYCDVEGSEVGAYTESGCILDWGDGNIEDNPAFLGGPNGTWTGDGAYSAETHQITLADTEAAFEEGALVGMLVNPDTTQYLQFPIVANTETTIVIWADWETINAGESWVLTGASYQVYDYRLGAGSPCIDAGDPDFVPEPGETDIEGQTRVWDGDGDHAAVVDMGSDEFGSFVFGDLNCDGAFDVFDVDAFVLALIAAQNGAQQDYFDVYPDCHIMLADMDADGTVGLFDVDPFVAVLTGE